MSRAAAIYVRISDDREGAGLGVDRQEQDCRAVLAREGWDLVRVYRENDTSAFKRKRVTLPDGASGMRVVRPAFRQLLADVASGAVTALIAYDLDRVARDPRDLEDLIDVVESLHVPTRSVTGSLNLSNDAGITMARVMVAVANKASRDQSRRIRRKYVELAEAGQVGNGGFRPFGYSRDRMSLVEEEAEHLRWAYAQVLAGRALRSICTDLAAAGVRSSQGNPWSPQALRYNLLSPRNAALREHRRVVVGPAVWPAIVDRDTWEKVCAVLRAPGRTPVRRDGSAATNARRHLLTGFLWCGRCGGKLVPRSASNVPQRYGCAPRKDGGCAGSHTMISHTDAAVLDLVFARLDRDARLDPAPPPDLTRELLGEIARQEQRLTDLAAAFADDADGNPLELRAAGAKIRSRISRLRAEVAASAVVVPRPVGVDVRASWDGYDLLQRRVVIASLIDRIDVGPGTGGRFNPNRLSVTWR